MQFAPDNQIGKELQQNLIQEIQRRFNKPADDAVDIADYIIYLIVAKKSEQEIVAEVKDIADISIDVGFIGDVYSEIRKLEVKYNQPPAAVEEASQPQQEQQQQSQASVVALQIPIGPKKQLTEEEKIALRSQRFGTSTRLSGRGGRGGITKTRTDFRNGHNNKNFLDPKKLDQIISGANNGAIKFVPLPPKGRCPDFPYCKNQNCEKAHPTKNCFNYPDCPNPPGTCNFLHPDQDQELIAKLETSKKEFEEKRKNQLMVKQGSCKYGLKCAKENCPFAHPTPANPESGKIETLEWCPQGKNCQDRNCTKSHPPPPTANSEKLLSAADLALEQCKFGSQCTNLKCPRRHATSAVPCRAGAECRRVDCTFSHPLKEPCRFGTKCTNKVCMYQHPEGRTIASHTWTKDGSGNNNSTSNRSFAVSEDQIMEQVAQ
ncbi:hypothetical protein MG5_00132 [Candida albicans P57072]|nr:hypothetical protein MG5_00132 [Candida albicans P57072]